MDINFFIREANIKEYEQVKAFYDRVIEDMQGMEYHPKWQKGVYPEYRYLQESIEKGNLHIVLSQEEIVGAMIINQETNDGYKTVSWDLKVADDEILIIHALGVLPTDMKKGIGSGMVAYAKKLAKEKQQKVIRLDVIDGNVPAIKLYEKAGFHFVETVDLFYEDTGWYKFHLYEYVV